MGLVMQVLSLLVKVCFVADFLLLQGSAVSGYITPSPATFSAIPPIVEGTPGHVTHGKPLRSNAPRPASQPNGSILHPPLAPPPVAQTIRLTPSLSPSPTMALPPHSSAPPPITFKDIVPSLPPSASQRMPPHKKYPILVPKSPVPLASPSRKLPHNQPVIHPFMPGSMPPNSHQNKTSHMRPPVSMPIAPAPREIPQNPPSIHPVMPGVPPSTLPVPVASPPHELPANSMPVQPNLRKEPPSNLPEPTRSPLSTPPASISWKRYGTPVAAPPNGMPNRHSPVISSPTKAPSVHESIKHSSNAPPLSFPKPPSQTRSHSPASLPSTSFHRLHHARKNISTITPNGAPNRHAPMISFPAKAPLMHKATRDSSNPPPLSFPKPPPQARSHSPASLPSMSFHRQHHARRNFSSPAPLSYPVPPPTEQDHIIPLAPLRPPKANPKSSQRDQAPSPLNSVFPYHSPFPSSRSDISPAPSTSPSRQKKMPFASPKISPSGSSLRNPKMPVPRPIQALPPPPPNEDCSSITCTEPLTNTPPGSPCGCVWPMQVGLQLSVALYTFFPLVSELAAEIAAGVFMKQSQVRIMGANAASQDPEKTVVLVDLVPLGEKFDDTTAYLTYKRFWHKQVIIKPSFFGDYEVLYVRYPGLPPSPPSASSGFAASNQYSNHGNNARTIQPLGVDVMKRKHKDRLSGSVIAIIVLSASVAVILCCAVTWIFLFKRRDHSYQPEPRPPAMLPSLAKSSGIAASMVGSGPSSSLSFVSSFANYTGSAKAFSSTDIEIATDNFDPSKILGEGGFGRVYSGVLEGGTKVAVKVLKRDDQQGGREFLAEVEMLSRLHHRNLVKLIGICTEERNRCLVYELIPNGSVESHLHGVDKEISPLDWSARMKIALGAARGLAYLHEDSSPRVIHRDFKSSNILLEHDFTPKVSDFGLARTALEEESRHISTRVMGTFGYVAPEYAMTGHLLVKSDVYSYGVVLLELLTGRKPVDMSQPPGRENLVAWARPRLTSREGLESIVDPSLGPDFPFESIGKVAAIASMCVQPEVSHRPFMGEVVQALKLVCNECDETKELGSRSCSQESIHLDARITTNSGYLVDALQSQSQVSHYDPGLDIERGLSASDLFSSSERLARQIFEESGSLRRHSSSGSLRTQRGRSLWQKMRRLSGGSASGHKGMLWPGSH